MRRLIIAFAAISAIVGAGVAIAAPVLHLTGWKATAGKPETATITRIGGNGPATVTFRTGAADDIAQPGLDYTAISQTISWAKGQTSATVTIPTFVNPARLGQNILFTGTMTGPNGTSSAQFLIMEPPVQAPPPPPAGSTTVIADEQAVPKTDPVHFLPIIYSETLYRTVHAGETVITGPSSPALACACGGQRREVMVFGLDGKFIGYLWADNLRAPPSP